MHFVFPVIVFAVISLSVWGAMQSKPDEEEPDQPETVMLASSSPIPAPANTDADFSLTAEDTNARLDRYNEAIAEQTTALDEVDEAEDELTPANEAEDELTPANEAENELTPANEPAQVITTTATVTSLKDMTLTYIGNIFCTGYDPYCRHCCSGTGLTASGATAEIGKTIAMNGVPFGTEVYIEGVGVRIVEDRGPMPGKNIDIACENHEACYAITGNYKVYLVERDTTNK